MDIDKELLPQAFDHLKSRPLSDEEKQQPHWKREAKFALQSYLSQKDTVDADDAIAWACLESYEGANGDNETFNTEFEHKQEALTRTIEVILEPGAVSLVIARHDRSDDDDFEDGELEDATDNKLRSLYADSDTLMIDGTALSGVVNVSFAVPAKSGARRISGSRSSVPTATLWLSHPGMAENTKRRNRIHGKLLRTFDEDEIDEPDCLHDEDQDEEQLNDLMRGDVARNGFEVDGEARRNTRMHRVEVDITLLTDRVVTEHTAITPELINSIMNEDGYVVAGREAVANLLLALDPEQCVVPNDHDIILDTEKQKRQLFQRGVARLLRNGRGFHQRYSDQDKHTNVLLGEQGVVVRNIVESERDNHVEAVLNAITKDIFLEMFSGVDPFTTSGSIETHSRDMLSEVSKIHWHYKEYFDIPTDTLSETHRQVKEKLQAAIDQAKLSVERLGDVTLKRFDELKDDQEIKDEFGEHDRDEDE